MAGSPATHSDRAFGTSELAPRYRVRRPAASLRKYPQSFNSPLLQAISRGSDNGCYVNYSRSPQFPVPSFQSPVSSFRFQFPGSQLPVSSFRFQSPVSGHRFPAKFSRHPPHHSCHWGSGSAEATQEAVSALRPGMIGNWKPDTGDWKPADGDQRIDHRTQRLGLAANRLATLGHRPVDYRLDCSTID